MDAKMDQLRIRLGNIHCDDCHANIDRILTQDFKLASDQHKFPNAASYVVDGDEVVISNLAADRRYNLTVDHLVKRLAKRFKAAGFEVLKLDATNGEDGVVEDALEATHSKLDKIIGLSQFKERIAHKKHVEHCSKCKEEDSKESGSDSSFETVVEKQDREFRVLFAIGGMTCAACAKSVNEAIERSLAENSLKLKDEDDRPNYSVDLVKNTAVVIVPNKHIINKIMTAIDESGFSSNLLEVLPVERTINTKITAAIAGITCAACGNSISSAVNELPFVLDCNINIVTKTGVFVMEGSDANLAKLKQTVEDCGFDFEVLSKDTINYNSVKKQSRSINLHIEGMFCSHCPEIVHDYLAHFGEAVVIETDSTLQDPFIRFTYVPNQDKNINLRRFIDDLTHIFPSSEDPKGYIIDHFRDGAFKASIVPPVSVDEKIRKLRRKELNALIRRLIIATVFAIPTFVFGVVGMALLPKGNKFRDWVDEPLWTGNVSRNTWVLFFLSTPVYFFAADVFHRKALLEIKSLWIHKNSFRRRLLKFGSMNLLMFLGTSVSYFASIVLLIISSQAEHTQMAFHTTYFDSVVFLSFFLLIGRLLEAISKSKTADAVSGLCDFKVSEATLVKTTTEDGVKTTNDVVVDVTLLEVGDLIRISPGESPAVDCVIIENSSEFDESALTGESTPVLHVPGHQIFSGTINVGNNALIAKVLSLESDSLIDQILNTVREGQIRKAPIERLADTLTGYFVPLIVLIAILTFVIWLSLSYSGALPDSYLDIDVGGWAMWSMEFAIAVFVIACPCGIGLAAPTALFVGSSLAAKNGVLVKGGGAAFQDAAKAKVVCFDKTGTLTYGKLKVTDYAFIEEEEKDHFISLQLARDLELSSKHPLAEAVKGFVEVVASNREFKLTNNKIPSVENVPGKGLRGDIVIDSNDDQIWQTSAPVAAVLGNEKLVKEYQVALTREQSQVLNKWKAEKKSVVLVAVQNPQKYNDTKFHLSLIMACRDQIRNETKAVIKHLQDKLGIECWMITGDNKITAQEIGKDIGIPEDHIVAEVLPEDKQAKVREIKDNKPGQVVAMVGDGINDAPALASADIGIALSSGADLAVTSSDFILLNKSHPLSCLLTVFDLAKVVFRRVKFNFGWALIYNIIGIPIAAGVIYPYRNSRLSPVWASAAMAASSVSVVLSSLALRLYKPKIKTESVIQEQEEEVKEVKF